jgi:hypothetical protein
MLSDVSESQRSQKGVTQGVNSHVSVRMSDASYGTFHTYASEPKFKSLCESVNVISVSDPYIHSVLKIFLQK